MFSEYIFLCDVSVPSLSLFLSLHFQSRRARGNGEFRVCVCMCGEGGTSFVCVTNSLSHSEQSTKLNHIYSLIYAVLSRCMMMLMCSVCVCVSKVSVAEYINDTPALIY